VGKKNLEVRPIAVNKGEIVKRILFNNPDAEFVFCAGDDKVSSVCLRADWWLPTMGSVNVNRPMRTCSVH